jgi:16S rRNA (cytosine1402-N4)-methyltransferase
MRMGTTGESAADLVARLSEAELAELIRSLGEERYARRVARAIVAARQENPINRTGELADIVRRAVPHREPGLDQATRTFQALRIAVNDELGALEALLRQLPGCLRPGGRAAVITFHSGEDRRVKAAFEEGRRADVYAWVAPEVVRASPAEQRANPRAKAAKLRSAQRSP